MQEINKFALPLDLITESQAKVATYTDAQLNMKYFESLGMFAYDAGEFKHGDDIFGLLGLAIGHQTISREIQIRRRSE